MTSVTVDDAMRKNLLRLADQAEVRDHDGQLHRVGNRGNRGVGLDPKHAGALWIDGVNRAAEGAGDQVPENGPAHVPLFFGSANYRNRLGREEYVHPATPWELGYQSENSDLEGVLLDFAVERGAPDTQNLGCRGAISLGINQGVPDGALLHFPERQRQGTRH